MAFLGLFPYITLLIIFSIRKNCSYRENFIYSSIIFASYIYFSTEILSFFNLLTPTAIILCWIIFFGITTLFAIRINISFPRLNLSPSTSIFGILILIPFTVGLIYPPNNWDSMTYHLPRIEHWLQNGSLSPYPTSIQRQNHMMPFAEMILLHFRALSGNDIFYNSLQWLSYFASILNVSLIAQKLGANRLGQFIAGVFCATIPMAILQASSTQNDLVVSWWLSSMVALALLWKKQGSLNVALMFGAALGLACLTKGTAYPIALPFVIYFAIHALHHCRVKFLSAALAAVLAIIFIIPTFSRNYIDSGSIIGGDTVADNILVPSINNCIVNILCNFGSNLEIPRGQKIHDKLTCYSNRVIKTLNINEKEFFRYGAFENRPRFNLHEDMVQNLLHSLLVLLILPICFIKYFNFNKTYIACYISSLILFCSLIGWQPWITRLQLPLLILFAPIFGIVAVHKRKICIFLVALLFISAIFVNCFNMSRPILNYKGFNPFIAINLDREKNYFKNKPDLYHQYKETVDKLVDFKNIGLIIGGDSWEYPLWAMMRQRGWQGNISHITNHEELRHKDAIFMLDIKERYGIQRPKDTNPFVLLSINKW
ncbi:MAG: ArnT family glycosyltransferase [Desulfobulbus sp.]|jgi:hypothetical protein